MSDFISRGACFRFLFLLGFLWLGTVVSSAVDAPATKPALAPIREFDTDTLSRLGREIYLSDQLAWQATDVVMGQVGMDRLQKAGARGWITDTSNRKALLVRFIRQGKNGLEALYDITFVKGIAPALSEPKNRELTPKQQAQAEALETAKAHFLAAKLPWCGGNPNTVVLDDPDGSGFLVYFLRPKSSMEEVPVGGHYRFTVSQDGKTVEQVDRLFASCLTLAKHPPDGGEMVALFMSHVVSPTPLETHVFLSLQDKLPFVVSTPDGIVWSVDQGMITRVGTLDELKAGKVHLPEPSKTK